MVEIRRGDTAGWLCGGGIVQVHVCRFIMISLRRRRSGCCDGKASLRMRRRCDGKASLRRMRSGCDGMLTSTKRRRMVHCQEAKNPRATAALKRTAPV
jgi:hypothetical protein